MNHQELIYLSDTLIIRRIRDFIKTRKRYPLLWRYVWDNALLFLLPIPYSFSVLNDDNTVLRHC